MKPPSSSFNCAVLPNCSDLCAQQLAFMQENFSTHEDILSKAPHFLFSLNAQCSDLDAYLVKLQSHLTKSTVSWISRSFSAKSALEKLTLQLQNLSLKTSQHGIGSKKFQKSLGVVLPRLAKEVKRIDCIRSYIETAVQLEALVGDIEDAALFVMAQRTGNIFSEKLSSSSPSSDVRKKHGQLMQAIKTMNDIEDMLSSVIRLHPQWHCLLSSVNSRIDKILSSLRPHVFADHRALLVSLGWPPKLLTSTVESGQTMGLPNPLVLMKTEKRESYSDSFIILCALQHLQTRREQQKINLQGEKKYITQLWAIDELVSPIASRMEYHFLKWCDQPQFTFALVYKVTRDFIAGVDDVLQPLIDNARLVSCSAKEAWIYAMVQMLSEFLAKRVFSPLAERYNAKHMKPDVMSSWLNLIDLAVAFDKQMQSLVDVDTCLFLAESDRYQGLSKGISTLTIFCDRLDWLKLWSKIEFKNAWKRLKPEVKEDKSWKICEKHSNGYITAESGSCLMSLVEDCKAPPIAEFSLKIAWEMIERCQTMPSILSRIRFIRSTVGKFLQYFFKIMLYRFEAAAIDYGNPDEDSVRRVCGLINTARHIELKLQEWSDDVEFMEMKHAENNSNDIRPGVVLDNGSFFREEIKSLSELQTNWLMELIGVLLRQFEILSWEYIQNKDIFEKEQDDGTIPVGEMDIPVCVDVVEAFDALRSHLHVIEINLNMKDFLDLWRSVAEGLDLYTCRSITTSNIQFSNKGICQFDTDVQALFSIFQTFCTRPEAFFPCIKETHKLLNLSKEQVKHLLALLMKYEDRTKNLDVYGITHLSIDQVVQILRNRRFTT